MVEVLPTGEASLRIASLDHKLTTLSLKPSEEPNSQARLICLQNIQRVSVGRDMAARGSTEPPADELCVTLLLEDASSVAFRFGSPDERDTFAFCLTMFVGGAPPLSEVLHGYREGVDDWEDNFRRQQKVVCGICY
jgi:hypothetical protein